VGYIGTFFMEWYCYGGRYGRRAGRDLPPVSRRVASVWAAFRLYLRDAGGRMPLNDSWIAATAIAEGVPVVSQGDDYDVPGLAVVRL